MDAKEGSGNECPQRVEICKMPGSGVNDSTDSHVREYGEAHFQPESNKWVNCLRVSAVF